MAAKGKGRWVRRGVVEQRAMLAKFAHSGLGVEQFCRRESISTASLYRWRTLHGDQVRQCEDSRSAGDAPAFVDLGAIRLPASKGGRLQLTVDLGDGLVLQLVRG